VKKLLFKFLLFFFSLTVFALPGINSISYEYSINDEIFNSEIINNCKRQVENDPSLANLGLDLEKINCNNHKDPKEFCNCIEMISNDGFNIDEEEERELTSIILQKGSGYIVEDFNEFLDTYPDYDNILKMAQSLGPGVLDQCLYNDTGLINDKASGKDNDVLKQHNLSDKILLAMSKKVENDIRSVKRHNQEDLSREFDLLKSFLLEDRGDFSTSFESSVSKIPFSEEPRYSTADLERFKGLHIVRWLKDSDTLPVDLNLLALDALTSNMSTGKAKPARHLRKEEKFLLVRDLTKKCLELGKGIKEFTKKNFVKEINNLKIDLFDSNNDNSKVLLSLFENYFDASNEEVKENRQATYFNLDKMYCKERSLVDLDGLTEEQKEKTKKILEEYGLNELLLSAADRKAEELNTEILAGEEKIDTATADIYYLELEKKYQEGLVSKRFLIKNEDTGKYHFDKNNKELIDLVERRQKREDILLVKNGAEVKDVFIAMAPMLLGNLELKINLNKKNKIKFANENKALAKQLEIEIKSIDNYANKKSSLSDKLIAVAGEQKAKSLLNNEVRKVAKASQKSNPGRFDLASSMMKRSSRNYNQRTKAKSRDRDLVNGIELFNKNFPAKQKRMLDAKISKDNFAVKRIITKSVSKVVKREVKPSENIFSVKKQKRSVNTIPVPQKQLERSIKSKREMELEKQYAALETLYNNEKKSSSSKVVSTKKNSLQAEILKLKKDLEKQRNDLKKEEVAIKAKTNKVEIAPVAERVEKDYAPSESFSSESLYSSGREYTKPTTEASRSNTATAASNNSSVQTSNNSNNARSVASTPQASSSSDTTKSSSGSKGTRGDSSNGKISLNKNSSSSSENYSISKSTLNSDSSGRVVQIDFSIESVPESERADILKKLFLEGEEQIILELPSGEKMVVKNTSKETKPTVKVSPTDEAKLRRKRRHEDLKRIIDLEFSSTTIE